ncbi:MAG: SRPBCC family protein [Thermoanaerobaculia bacterium]
MNTPSFSANRVTRTHRQSIAAPADRVFPLLCPVREAEWLADWEYTMIRSVSGLVEPGAVFTTPGAGEPDTVWVVTRHDTRERVVEFTRFTPGSRVCVLRIGVAPSGAHRSQVDIAYTYTAIGEAGNAFIDRFTEDSFRAAMAFWEDSMNHWLATGELLARHEA